MSRVFVTSSSNPRLKAIRRLRRAVRRNGDETFVVEGRRQLGCALAAGVYVRELYVARELFLGATDAQLAWLAERGGANVVELARAASASISGNVRPDGFLAVVERWPATLEALRLEHAPLLLVAEGIERPGNLGAIVRAACAAGADALVACDGATDLFHPDVVRGSVGTLFRLPVARAATPDAIAWLRGRRIQIVVATPSAERPYWECDYSGACAIVVGNERGGVTSRWVEAADEAARIPMPGPADSLNVAVAAGIVLFEAARQRCAADR